MKVLSVVGARPQFIKAAMISKKLRINHNEILVHTGQHYDYNMSERFFEELEIPNPDYNLGISGGTHAQMTGKMLIAIEEVLLKEKPDIVVVFGDTNSTLASVLAASKLHIPIAHVEAGARTHCKSNPEELNRICADHLSDLLLVSTESGMEELKRENLSQISVLVGDPMYDAFLNYSGKINSGDFDLVSLCGNKRSVPDYYYYLTCHREENTLNDINLVEILSAMNTLPYPVVYPVHPRNKKRVTQLNAEHKYSNILFCEPVGYLESIALVNGANAIVTDSGGLQREAFFARKKCVTILDFVVWPETMVKARNELSKPDRNEILDKLEHQQEIDENYYPFGDGNSSEKIVREIDKINIK